MYLLSLFAAANNVGLTSVSSRELEQLRSDLKRERDEKQTSERARQAAERQAEQNRRELHNSRDAFATEISNLQQQLQRERQLRVTAEQQINAERELRRTAEQQLERGQQVRVAA